MKKYFKTLYIILLLSITDSNYAQINKTKTINDFVVTLHEETLNKVLAALGDISGANDYEVMLIKGKYQISSL